MVQGVILAAGRGSRMLELTKDQPKGMVNLGGKSLLEWQIEGMKKAGIKKISFVGGYQIDKIKSLGFPCFENSFWAQTNMVESLKCAEEVLKEEETIISYGDIVYSSFVIQKLISTPTDLTITYDTLWEKLWKKRFKNPLEDAETFSIREGKLIDIGRRPTSYQEVEGQYMGLTKMSVQGWKVVKEALKSLDTKTIDMTTLFQHLIQLNISIYGIPIQGMWCEVDSKQDLCYYEKKLKDKSLWMHDWRS